MKRLRWSAVLLGLVLATSWAGAAHATTNTTPGETTTTTVGETATVDETTTTTTTTEPGGGEQPCSVAEGLTSHSDISIDDSAHPTASAQFTVKEGCQVFVFLVSGKITGNSIEDFDFAPANPEDALFGPGDYKLTVRLPDCARFIVDFVGFKPEPEPIGGPALMSRAKSEAAQTLSEEGPPPGDGLLDEVRDTTTNCPTETSNPEVVPTTVVQVTTPTQQGLPDTGTNAMPVLIAGLVLVAGGAAALFASRARSRRAK